MKRVLEFLILCLIATLWAAFIFMCLFGGRAFAQATTIRKVEFTSVYDIGSHQVAVPHAFFKAAWVQGSDSVIGCWFFFNR